MTGVNTVNELIELYKKLKIRFGEAQFNRQKFCTNDKELQQFFEEEVKDTNIDKVLSIEWDEFIDKLIFWLSDIFCFVFVLSFLNVTPTKRHILAIISSIYDPVGYLQPITTQLKILIQEICKVKFEWDDVIDIIVPKLEEICNHLEVFGKIMIDKCYFYGPYTHAPIEHCYYMDFWIPHYRLMQLVFIQSLFQEVEISLSDL